MIIDTPTTAGNSEGVHGLVPEGSEESRRGPSHSVGTLELTVPSLSVNRLWHKHRVTPCPSYVM